MNYRDFQNDYPEIFDIAIEDLDWELIFTFLEKGEDDLLSTYLKNILDSYMENAVEEEQGKPEPDYDRKRETAAINFETAAFITNMERKS